MYLKAPSTGSNSVFPKGLSEVLMKRSVGIGVHTLPDTNNPRYWP